MAAFEERAAVGHAGQRVGLGRQSLGKLGALLRHGDAQERQAESDEQRLERHHGRHRAVGVAAAERGCQVMRIGDARQKKARMSDHQHQCRPAREQIAVARVPQFARGKERIARGDRCDQTDARRHRLREAIKLKCQSHSAGPTAKPTRLMRRPSKLRAPHHMKP
jgi:hypothetical protein